MLEIESHCRSDCKYCSEGPFLQRTGARLAKTTVKAMIIAAEYMGAHEITLRGGEATLHPDFKELWEYAVLRSSAAVSTITNGMEFTGNQIGTMLKNLRYLSLWEQMFIMKKRIQITSNRIKRKERFLLNLEIIRLTKG